MKFETANAFLKMIPESLTEIRDTCLLWPKSNHMTYSKYFENICVDVIKEHLFRIPDIEVVATDRNKYPEILFIHDGKEYAIDVKTGRSYVTTPGFDLSYLSTIDKQVEKYQEQWIVSIAYDDRLENPLVDIHFNKMINLINTTKVGGLSIGGNGIKIRPISWKDIRDKKFKIRNYSQLKPLLDGEKTLKEQSKKTYKVLRDRRIQYLTAKQIMDYQVSKFDVSRNRSTLNEQKIAQIIRNNNLDLNRIMELAG